MMTEDYALRFDGIRRLYGQDAFEIFPRLHIAVVGIGGVGSWAVEALARTGVGQLTFIDPDDVELSNMNRQLPALDETIERPKVAVLAERVRQINPDCKINAIDDLLSVNNMQKYLGRDFDYVIDAIDSVRIKSEMIYYCRRNKIPIITTGGAGGVTDPTRIMVEDISRTYNDPLIARVRAKLRNEYGFTRNPKKKFEVDCVFSSEQPVYPKEDGTVCQKKPGIRGVSLNCSTGYGSATFITASIGFAAVARALSKAVKRHLRNEKLLGSDSINNNGV
jgi:tRNA A37 threonylcarbamoyladenosine dehydratase